MFTADSPTTVNMRIRHYFTTAVLAGSGRQTREKTCQTSPKKPVRTSTGRAGAGAGRGAGRLQPSHSLRLTPASAQTAVPSLGQTKGDRVDTDTKVSNKV